MDTPVITIVSVNWFSTDFLIPLLNHLAEKAAAPKQLTALIVDNTNGKDTALSKLSECPIPCTILPCDSRAMKSSRAHAAALDAAMPRIQTPYCLTVDPDVHVFKKHWDQFCIAVMKSAGAVAIGAPYPNWKIGKYHDFPSPVFCFFETGKLLDLKAPWTPFGKTRLYNFRIFLIRQFARLGGLITRRRYERVPLFRMYARTMERLFGTFSQDTGWQIAEAVRQTNRRAVVFSAAGTDTAETTDFKNMASEYELYGFEGEPILTHKYGTGVRLWKTPRGADSRFWFDCIQQAEQTDNNRPTGKRTP